jgi:3-oxoacyl-[acyl-carrier-protein] synthase II
MPCRIAGKIDFDELQDHVLSQNIINRSDLKSVSLANVYALTAANEAFKDANWYPKTDQESYRTGCTIATGISGIPEIADAAIALANSSKGYKAISPYFVTKILPNMSAGLISIKHKIKVKPKEFTCDIH